MQEAFEKLKGMDIFSLKSYTVQTGFLDISGIWVMFNEIFVNFPFFLLNLIVGFFSLMIRIVENVRLYRSYFWCGSIFISLFASPLLGFLSLLSVPHV